MRKKFALLNLHTFWQVLLPYDFFRPCLPIDAGQDLCIAKA